MSMYGMREGSHAGEWVMNTISRNPEGLLLLAAGAALLMRSGHGQSRSGRQYAGSHHSETGRRVGGGVKAAQRASTYVSEATDQVGETVRSYASSAMEYAGEATQTAMDRSSRVADQVEETAA